MTCLTYRDRRKGNITLDVFEGNFWKETLHFNQTEDTTGVGLGDQLKGTTNCRGNACHDLA